MTTTPSRSLKSCCKAYFACVALHLVMSAGAVIWYYALSARRFDGKSVPNWHLGLAEGLRDVLIFPMVRPLSELLPLSGYMGWIPLVLNSALVVVAAGALIAILKRGLSRVKNPLLLAVPLVLLLFSYLAMPDRLLPRESLRSASGVLKTDHHHKHSKWVYVVLHLDSGESLALTGPTFAAGPLAGLEGRYVRVLYRSVQGEHFALEALSESGDGWHYEDYVREQETSHMLSRILSILAAVGAMVSLFWVMLATPDRAKPPKKG